MKDKPWILDDDPLKATYGLLSNLELELFKNLYKQYSKKEIGNDTVKLLDFYNKYNEYNEYALFEQLCSIVNENEYLYWIPAPIDNYSASYWDDYSPVMIAKTSARPNIINDVSASFMQMIAGAYIMFDSKSRFWGIIVDGYYMLVFMNKEFSAKISLEFTKNWDNIDENLDFILKKSLFEMANIEE